jgi:hypothetical protein
MSAIDQIRVILIAVVIIGYCAWAILWTYSRGPNLLEDWAQRNGFRLVSYQYQWFHKGPFWLASKDTKVYRITVVDPVGKFHTGWALCGNRLFGLWSNSVEVKWDK